MRPRRHWRKATLELDEANERIAALAAEVAALSRVGGFRQAAAGIVGVGQPGRSVWCWLDASVESRGRRRARRCAADRMRAGGAAHASGQWCCEVSGVTLVAALV